MPDALGRTQENEFAEVILRILSASPAGQSTFQNLFIEIPKNIALTDQDRSPSVKRPNESFWQQRVRNIRSHSKSTTNYINLGYLLPIRNGLKITTAGRKHIGN